MIFIIILALALRLINLNQSLWLDEAFQFKATNYFSLKELLTIYLPKDFNPPLSYLVNFFLSRIIGWSEVALRFPSVIFGTLSVYITFLIAKQLNLKKPLLPALFLASAPLHIYYSQEARMYSLTCFLVTISTWSLIRILKQKSKYWLYAILLGLILYSHYLAWFIIPAHLIFTFIYKKEKIKPIILAQVAALASFLPWLPIIITQLQTGLAASSSSNQWASVVGDLSLKSTSLVLVKFIIGRISIENNLFFGLILLIPLIFVSWLLFLAIFKSKYNQLAKKSLLTWLLTPLIFIITISIKVPVLSYFRLLFLLPAFYLLLGLGLENLKKPTFAIITLLSINLACSSIYLFNHQFHRENWKSISNRLVELNQTQDPVLIIPVVDAPLKYYYSQNQIVATDHLERVINQKTLWYISYAEPIFDPQYKFRQKLDSVGFKEVFQQHFRGNLTLIKYTL